MKTHKLTDTHPDGIKWMLNKEFIFKEDIIKLIDVRVENLNDDYVYAKDDAEDDVWANCIDTIIKELKELKQRIEGK